MKGKHVSVSAAVHARIAARADRDGVTKSSIVEAAIARALDGVIDAPAVPVSVEIYHAVGKVARHNGEPMADALDRAIVAALDDADRWVEPPSASRRACRTPMVDHARRTA